MAWRRDGWGRGSSRLGSQGGGFAASPPPPPQASPPQASPHSSQLSPPQVLPPLPGYRARYIIQYNSLVCYIISLSRGRRADRGRDLLHLVKDSTSRRHSFEPLCSRSGAFLLASDQSFTWVRQPNGKMTNVLHCRIPTSGSPRANSSARVTRRTEQVSRTPARLQCLREEKTRLGKNAIKLFESVVGYSIVPLV